MVVVAGCGFLSFLLLTSVNMRSNLVPVRIKVLLWLLYGRVLYRPEKHIFCFVEDGGFRVQCDVLCFCLCSPPPLCGPSSSRVRVARLTAPEGTLCWLYPICGACVDSIEAVLC